MIKKLAIIGGGAAGLLTASCLDSRFDVTVYERNERVGKKLLSTGNGRCNLINTRLSPESFNSSDRSAKENILSAYTAEDILAYFRSLGLLTKEESNGRVYPLANQATAVLDVLRYSGVRNNVTFKCGFTAKEIIKKENGFEILSLSGERAFADAVILATGGMSAPKTGSDGIGYTLAKALGHTVTPLKPVLVPLKSDKSFTLPLKGIRARVKLTLNNSFSESGEIQFSDYGISGIASMQASRHLTGSDLVSIDFAEDYTVEEILALLKSTRAKNPPLGELFLGILNRRIGEELIKRTLKCSLSTPSERLSDSDLKKLADCVKGFVLPVTGTLSWDNAQVTAGGIPLSEIDTATMQSKLCKNLYLLGEMLDCDGECGGYNLSWAWITALSAVKALNNIQVTV